jgi:hypothetical protein
MASATATASAVGTVLSGSTNSRALLALPLLLTVHTAMAVLHSAAATGFSTIVAVLLDLSVAYSLVS